MVHLGEDCVESLRLDYFAHGYTCVWVGMRYCNGGHYGRF